MVLWKLQVVSGGFVTQHKEWVLDSETVRVNHPALWRRVQQRSCANDTLDNSGLGCVNPKTHHRLVTSSGRCDMDKTRADMDLFEELRRMAQQQEYRSYRRRRSNSTLRIGLGGSRRPSRKMYA